MDIGQIIAYIIVFCIVYYVIMCLLFLVALDIGVYNWSIQLYYHIDNNGNKNDHLRSTLMFSAQYLYELISFIRNFFYNRVCVIYVTMVFVVTITVLLMLFVVYLGAVTIRFLIPWPIGCGIYTFIMGIPPMFSLKDLGVFKIIDVGLGWLASLIGGKTDPNEEKTLSNMTKYFFQQNFMKNIEKDNEKLAKDLQNTNLNTKDAKPFNKDPHCGEKFGKKNNTHTKNEPSQLMYEHTATKREKVIAGSYKK